MCVCVCVCVCLYVSVDLFICGSCPSELKPTPGTHPPRKLKLSNVNAARACLVPVAILLAAVVLQDTEIVRLPIKLPEGALDAVRGAAALALAVAVLGMSGSKLKLK